MNITWATDIHLDFIARPERADASGRNLDLFCSLIKESNPEGLILTGDISLSSMLEDHLVALETRLNIPIYFVLGNHDFWFGGFEETRKIATRVSTSSSFLKYMSYIPYLSISPTTIVVGHDGWYDALYGILNSDVMMNDWSHISDFSGVVTQEGPQTKVDMNAVLSISRAQAHTAATRLMNSIKNGIRQQKPNQVVVLTHVPPFVELQKNLRAGISSVPWYTSKMMGDMLLSAAQAYPNVNFEVFCGHTHTRTDVQVAKNMFCHVGGAEYGNPGIQGSFVIK